MLEGIGYVVVRRKGSHVRLTKKTAAGEHHITVPDHRTLAKGTLADILSTVGVHSGIARDELLKQLKG